MADPHNVEFEVAKFLQKLIHESTDEPAKLATKLYVILQHMKASGKENSMPYQVISRAMETVINQHGLDIEALMSSHLPLSSGSHAGESAIPRLAGCSQAVGIATDSKSSMIDNDTTRPDGFCSGRPPAGPSSIGNEPLHGPDDGKVDAANDPEASPIQCSDTAETSRVTLKVDEQSQGPDDCHAIGDVGDPSFDDVATSTLRSKKIEELHGPNDDTSELEAGDAPAASCVVGFDTVVTSTLDSREKEGCHGPKGISSNTLAISSSELKRNEECYGRDVCNTKQDVGDAPIASKDVCNNTAEASTMEDKDQAWSRGADIGNEELNAGGAPTVSFVIPMGNAELGAGDAPLVSGVVHTTASLEEGKKEECCGLDVANSELDASDAATATCVINNNVTAVSILEDKEQQHDGPAVSNAEQDAHDAPAAYLVVDTDTTAASILVENKDKLQGPDAGSAEQNDLDAPTASCGIGTDPTAASTLAAVEQGEHNGCDVSNADAGAPATSCVAGIDALTMEVKEQGKSHEPDFGRAEFDDGDALTAVLAVGTDTTAATRVEEKQQEGHHDGDNVEQDADDSPTASCVVDTDTATAPTLDEGDLEPHELDVGNAGKESDDSPLASCAVNTLSTLGQNDQEEHCDPDVGNAEQDTVIASADSCVVGINIATAARLEENDLEEHHDLNVGSAKQDDDDAPDQEEHHELDIGGAEHDADKTLVDSYAGNNTATATAANLEEDYQEEHHEPGVGDAEQHTINAPSASCDVGTDTTSASTLQENDKEEHHEPDVGNAEQDADIAPTDTRVAVSDIVATALEEGYDQVEHLEPDVGNAEQAADNAPAISCIVSIVTATATTAKVNHQEEHHDATAAFNDAPTASCDVGTDTTAASGDAPTASCGVRSDTTAASCDTPEASFIVCTDNTTESDDAPSASCVPPYTATALTLKENDCEESTGPDLCHAEQNVGDVHAPSCVVNANATAASDEAPTASCGVVTDTISASDDAPTASCGVGTDTVAASCDMPTASFVVCTDNTMESSDAPDTATALSLKENDNEESTGPDLCLTEENVDDVHAASCDVNTDATAASDDAPTASCGLGTNTFSASGDAPTASCGVGTDTAAASCDTPTASFVVCMDNTTESCDGPPASCVVVPNTATALTLKENDNEKTTGALTSDEAPTASSGAGTDTIAATDDAPAASCCVGTHTTAAFCDNPAASFALCTDNTMESGDAPSASCVIAPDTATASTLEENDIKESTGCKNGNAGDGFLDASAISSSDDLTTSTFNAEQ